MQDASILLPPTGTPLTGIDFIKRLPCGEVERTRRVGVLENGLLVIVFVYFCPLSHSACSDAKAGGTRQVCVNGDTMLTDHNVVRHFLAVLGMDQLLNLFEFRKCF